jgi:hypothetical protein
MVEFTVAPVPVCEEHKQVKATLDPSMFRLQEDFWQRSPNFPLDVRHEHLLAWILFQCVHFSVLSTSRS